jgi:catechol 2,3-dioxygenase-like lactoylglutathione lyase family enzyme
MSALLQPAIDHVVINVGDQLDAAADRFQKLGFQLTERGHHSMGSSNNLTIFGTDYLELLGFEPGRVTTRIELLDMPTGLGGLVFKPSAAPEFRDQLAARGVPIGESREFTRPVDLPGGPQDAHFRVTHLAPEIALGGRVFFCHHFTPELVWRPEWQGHANGVTAIAEFVVACPDPARSAAPYRLIFGDEAFAEVPGGLALQAGQGKVLLLTPQTVAARFGAALPPLPVGSGDHMVALVFRTASLAKARAALAAGGIPAPDFEAGVLVSAGDAFGVALGFTA